MSATPPTNGILALAARLARAAFAAAVVPAFVIVNQSAVHWRDNIADDHLYAYGGWRILHGAAAYTGVWDNKPPGIWWLNAVAFALCGDGLGPDLLLGAVALVISIVAFTSAARSLYGENAHWPGLLTGCVMLTHLQFECGANRTETFVAAAEICAVAAYLRWRVRGGGGWLFCAGLAAGSAPWFKQTGIALIAALCLHFAFSRSWRWRNALRLLLGLTIVPALAIGALLGQGALGAAYDAVIVFNRYFFIAGDATWIHLGKPFALYWPELRQIGAILLLCGAALPLAALPLPRVGRAAASKIENCRAPGTLLLWIWLLLEFYLACVATGRLAYHLAPILAPLGLLALAPLMAVLQRRDLIARLTARPIATASAVLFLWILSDTYSGSWLWARDGWFEKTSRLSLERREPAPYEAQAAAIRALTRPDDLIYVWGWSPGTYRFAYRRCPSRFATIEHVSHVYPYGNFIVDGAMRDIQANPPAIFVISVTDLPALTAPPQSDFARWLLEHYQLKESIQGMNLMIRR